MVTSSKTGAVQTCPLCDGTGVNTNYVRMPRWYLLSASALVLGANAPSRGSMSVDAIAPFEAVFLVATRTSTFTTELFDQSGRAWQSFPVNDANQWGTAQNPFPLMAPLILPAQSVLNWVFTDTSGFQNTIQPCLIGFDLYEA